MAILGGALVVLVLNNDAGNTFGMANDDFAQAAKLGAIAILVAAGLVGRRIGMGEFARNVALWLAVALVLVAGYQYRYELQDVASRVTAGLVPSSPVASFDAEGRATVMLDRALSGHFETTVRIDGGSVRAMVDTGASATVLTMADARSVGIEVDRLSFTVPVSTANGTGMAARAVAEEISIGDITRRNVPMLIAQQGALEQSLLGMNFIGTLSGFDMRGGRLTLRD
ncbi:MAG: TIGR02281 family clan AA aspartic protease [Methylobacterium mesophilicum]|nr:TIGR02281 family clan AA aspartic protease [Methylobacterium mesophilicum]